MFVFLPVFLILFSVIIVQIFGRSRSPMGTKWLVLAVVTLITWIANLILGFRLPSSLILNEWFPTYTSNDSIIFTLDLTSWIFSFALITQLVGIVFSGTTRLDQKNTLSQWTVNLLFTALGLISILANSPLTFILAWTLIDVSGIIELALKKRENDLDLKAVLVFIPRLLGSLFVLLAMILEKGTGNSLALTQVSGVPFTLIVIGAGMRLGILPLQLSGSFDAHNRKDDNSLLRIAAPLSAIALISRLPIVSSISGWVLVVFIFSIFGAIYGTIKWFTSSDELVGGSFWLLSFSSLVMVAFLNGKPESALALGLIMVIVGSWMSVGPKQFREFKFILPMVMLAMTGLPYTPLASAISGITTGHLPVFNLFLWISLAFLTAGVAKHSINAPLQKVSQEKWMKLFHGFSLGFLAISLWLTGIWQFSQWAVTNNWWVGVFVTIVTAVILLFQYSKRLSERIQAARFYVIKKPLLSIGFVLDRFLQFGWFYQLIRFVLGFFQRIISTLNFILEGEGGVLWAMVFLALLISLIANSKGG
jgi:hypothetical protein